MPTARPALHGRRTSVPSAAGSCRRWRAHGGDATLAWSDGGAGAVQARTLDSGAPTAVHLTRPMRVLNDGQADPGRLDRRRHLLPDHLRGVAAGGDLPQPAVGGGDLADDDGDRTRRTRRSRARPCACGYAAPTRAATSARGRCRAARRGGQRPDAQAEEAGRAGGVEDRQEGQGVLFQGLHREPHQGRHADLARPARRVALLVATGRGHGSVSVSLGKKRLGTFSLASAKPAAQVVIPVAVFSGVRTGKLKVVVTTNGKPVRIDGVYAGPRASSRLRGTHRRGGQVEQARDRACRSRRARQPGDGPRLRAAPGCWVTGSVPVTGSHGTTRRRGSPRSDEVVDGLAGGQQVSARAARRAAS